MSDAIQAEGLVKRFGETTALAGADLEARTGSVLAVLGPNGAGKTTAVRILATLLQPDAGRATVAGYDVVAQAHQVRQLIALTGQYAAVDESLTGTENLVLIGRLLGLSRAGSRRRAATLLEEFALADAAGRATKTYSGGMRRRLDLAASMVGQPRVLYLDEPTTGLDPRGRGDLWRVVRGLVGEGVTVLLTTQYMDEADQLADDVVVIDRGRVVATGTPDQLKTQVGGQVLHVSPVREADMATVVRVVTGRRRMGDDGGDRKAARRPTEVTMAEVLVLSEDEVASLLDVEELLDALADAFRDLSAGRASVPPRVAARAELGMLAAMPVALPGVALGAKLVSVFPDNHARGLPSHQGVIVLFGEQDGTPLAVMDGRHITAVRTGAATAVAARALARPDAEVLAILGAGVQGHSHLDALPRVRGFREIRVASRTPANAAALAALHPAARPVGSFEEAVTGADVVCCCTDAHQPVIRAAWLAPGAHVSSVGGIFGPELDADTVRAGRVFVEWRGAASNPPPAGAHELQGLDGDGVTELGEVLAGTLPGRTSDQEITVYKSTGHAIEDAAAARLVHERARQAGAGVTVTL